MENTINKIILDKIKYMIKQETGYELSPTTELDISVGYANAICNTASYYIKTEVFGKRKIKELHVPIEVPKNWINHLFMDIGLKYKTKTIYKTTTLNHTAIFPEFNTITDKHHIIYIDEIPNLDVTCTYYP